MSKAKKLEAEKVWMERTLKAEGDVEVLKSRVAGLIAALREVRNARCGTLAMAKAFEACDVAIAKAEGRDP